MSCTFTTNPTFAAIPANEVLTTTTGGLLNCIPFSILTGDYTIPVRDTYGNIYSSKFIYDVTSTTSSTTVTPLLKGSAGTQILTGTQPQTFSLPDATLLSNNTSFNFINNSTNVLSITDYNSNALTSVSPGGNLTISCSSNSSTSGVWAFYCGLAAGATSGTSFTNLPGYLTCAGLYSSSAVTMLPLGTATSSSSFSSNALNLDGSYWNGSTSATDTWTFQSVLGGGTNPYSIFNVAHSGSPGLTTCYFPAIDNTPIGLINPSPASFSTVNMVSPTIPPQALGNTPAAAGPGSLALTSTFILAVWNGSAWVRTSDGTTAVTF